MGSSGQLQSRIIVGEVKKSSRLAKRDQAFSKQGKRVVLHRDLERKDIEAYGFDLFGATLYDRTHYE